MTGFVHALVGSAVSRLARSRRGAYALGVVSHAVGDILPHHELPLPADATLTAGLLGWVVARHGLRSRELAGALGALSPDAEHLPTFLGLKGDEGKLFVTHGGPVSVPHGPKPGCDALQVLLLLGALLVVTSDRTG